jgi:hypothetical protein
MSVVLTAVTAVAALVAAIAAGYAAYMAKKQVDAGMKPVLALSGGEASFMLEDGLYPIFLDFSNYGKGAANVLALDLDGDIKAHISAPINIGSEGKAQIKIWLPTANEEYAVKLSVYYWDIQGFCYRTEIQTYLTVKTAVNGSAWLYWRIDRDRMKEIGKKPRPTSPLHWEPGVRTDLFCDPWWSDNGDKNQTELFPSTPCNCP